MRGLKGDGSLSCVLIWWPWWKGKGGIHVLLVLKKQEASTLRDMCMCRHRSLGTALALNAPASFRARAPSLNTQVHESTIQG